MFARAYDGKAGRGAVRLGRLRVLTPAQRAAAGGVLLALTLALRWAEDAALPVLALPPGIKPGLSNIPVMLACGMFGIPAGLFLALGKAVFSGLSRGIFAAFLSGAGGLTSALVTGFLLRFRKKLGYIGIGICGALTHTIAQLLVAGFLTGSGALLYAAPLYGVCAALSGALTGALLGASQKALGSNCMTKEWQRVRHSKGDKGRA